MDSEIAKLLGKIERAWGEVDAFLQRLTDEQKTLPTDAGGWAVKDHLMHMAVWEDGIEALLTGKSRDARMGFADGTPKPRGLDNLNDAIFRQHRDKTLPEVLETRRTIHERLVATLGGLSSGDLKRPIRDFDQTSGSSQPVEGLIVGNTSAHYRNHLRWMQAIVGEA